MNRETPDPADGLEANGGARGYRRSGLGFRTRLTLGLMAAAVLPVAGFGIVVLLVVDTSRGDTTLDAAAPARRRGRRHVRGPARRAAGVGPQRAAAGDRASRRAACRRGTSATTLELPGDDEFSRLAESHNRLARILERRNRELRQILDALEATTLHERPEASWPGTPASARGRPSG